MYGSKHNPFEIQMAEKLAKHFGVEWNIIDLTLPFMQIKSNLMATGGEIPEGHYNDESMTKTVVPGRNHIFAAVLAGIAESKGMDAIALAVHSGDHHIYPDCRPNFIEALTRSIRLQSEKKVDVLTPFKNLDKEGILKVGMSFRMPYELTRTCYKPQKLSCGKCGSCRERLEAWEKIGQSDPIEYEFASIGQHMGETT